MESVRNITSGWKNLRPFSRYLPLQVSLQAYWIGITLTLTTIASGQEEPAAPPPVAVPPVAAVIPPVAEPAVAFRSIPIAEAFKNEKVVREKKKAKDEMLKGATPFNEKELSEYYLGYLIPNMTSIETPEACNDSRREILEDIEVRAEKSDAVLKPYSEWLLKQMESLVNGNYQPSAGINAVLIIGRLNETRMTSTTASKPLSRAAGILLRLSIAGKNDGIRAAAMKGLERHLVLGQLNWKDTQKQAVADALLKGLQEPQPKSRSNASDGWLRGRMLDLLLQIKHSKEAEVYTYAVSVLSNKTTDPILLEKALAVAGKCQTQPTNLDLVEPAIANSINYLIREARKWQQTVKGDVPGGFMPGGYNPGGSGPPPGAMSNAEMMARSGGNPFAMGNKAEKPKRVNPYDSQPKDMKVKRRQLHQLLETVRFGLDGVHYGPVIEEPTTGLIAILKDGPNKQIIKGLPPTIFALQEALNSALIKERMTLASETSEPFDALIAAAELFPGVEKTDPLEIATIVPSTDEENADPESGDDAENKAKPEGTPPAAKRDAADDGFSP